MRLDSKNLFHLNQDKAYLHPKPIAKQAFQQTPNISGLISPGDWDSADAKYEPPALWQRILPMIRDIAWGSR